MSLLSSLRGMLPRPARRSIASGSRAGRRRGKPPLLLEALEDRMLLSYTFTLLEETGSGFTGLRVGQAINDRGVVAFQADLPNGQEAIYRRELDGSLTTIATIDGSSSGAVLSPFMNDAGQVSFGVQMKDGSRAIFRGDGQDLTAIADTSPNSPFSSLPNPAPQIGDDGTVYFRATLKSGGAGLFTDDGRHHGYLYLTGGQFSAFLNSPNIQRHGDTAAFRATLSSGPECVCSGSGGPVDIIATAGGTYRTFLSNTNNDAGTVVYTAVLTAGGQAVVTPDGILADTRGPYSQFFAGQLSLNNDGTVVFGADLKAGGHGIFQGPDAVADKIIATGDPLFGSTVTAFPDNFLNNRGLNDAGQIVFRATLADGRTVLALAEPDDAALAGTELYQAGSGRGGRDGQRHGGGQHLFKGAISLTPNEAAPQPVGEPITWTATVPNAPPGLVYQFSVGPRHGPLHVVRDFSPGDHFTWAPMQEGTYRVKVAVKDGFDAQHTRSAVVTDEVDSRVTGAEAVISPTSNPLVALYSVPPGPKGTVHVEFAVAGEHPSWRSTNDLPSRPGKSTNVFVAGLLPHTTYEMRHVFSDGTPSSPLLFSTGSIPSALTFPTFTVVQPPGPGSDLDQDLIYHEIRTPLTTDLSGRVVWYFDTRQSGLLPSTFGISAPQPGGTVLGFGSDRYAVPNKLGLLPKNVLREIDLAGDPVRETNLDVVNAQLKAMGHEPIYGFYHEAEHLPNGDTVALGITERTVNIHSTPTNYVGTMVLVLDENLQLTWAWDAFDHLDVNRGPVLGEVDDKNDIPVNVVPNLPAVDWLHHNSVAWSPADGDLILSLRHQDWVIKIDYRNGDGDGHVVWRLGQDGDFAVHSTDPNPWFSHQHHAHYIDDSTIILFDNGNTRRAGDPTAHSRGQVWKLDERTRTATLVFNADLGNYSPAVGAAQRLSNGNYSFDSGDQGQAPNLFGQTIEVRTDGSKAYVLEVERMFEFRSYRIRTLYEGTGAQPGGHDGHRHKGPISLTRSEAAPQLVGEPITWTATVPHATAGLVYQFSVGAPHSPFHVVRDFSPADHFTWAPMQEGTYRVKVAVKDGFDAEQTRSAVVTDEVDSRVTGAEAVISPTANPLVALYSVPPGPEGTVHVEFAVAGDQPSWRSTNALPSEEGESTNFFVAGLLPNTTYQMRHVFSDGTTSSPLLFTTGSIPSTLTFPTFTVRQPPGPQSDLDQDMIYHVFPNSSLIGNRIPYPLATDLSGRVLWYFDPQQSGLGITNMGPAAILLPGGTVLGFGQDRYSVRSNRNVLREIDLAGDPVRETNIDAVNAQLTALGHDIIYGFSHDAKRFPDGSTVTQGVTERVININGTPTNYIGNMIVVLDQDFQVIWAWDAFDHLDVNRGPVLGEVCLKAYDPTTGGAPTCVVPNYPAVDWVLTNTVSWSPADGNLIMSVRHQDWVVKIDYRNGEGDGHVIWRLGKDGDFTVNSADPYPWFSHEHDPHYIDDSTLVLFDNGNTRRAGDPTAHSRGQVWTLDEDTMTATPVLNADLGNYSDALGAAQRLSNGNFLFTSGRQGRAPNWFGQSIEVLPDGTKAYVLEVAIPEYRSYRIRTLYEGTDELASNDLETFQTAGHHGTVHGRSSVAAAAFHDSGRPAPTMSDAGSAHTSTAVHSAGGPEQANSGFAVSTAVPGRFTDDYWVAVAAGLNASAE